MPTLGELMRKALLDTGVLLEGERSTRMEVVDTRSNTVWLSYNVATKAEFDALELPKGFERVGIAAGSMDAALFNHSPSGEGKPVRECTISGHSFINAASPLGRTIHESGLVELQVNKSHTLGFQTGRDVVILRCPKGDFVETVGDSEADAQFILPDDGALLTVKLKDPWVVHLPNPTHTYWRFGRQLRSFQGPVDTAHLFGQ